LIQWRGTPCCKSAAQGRSRLRKYLHGNSGTMPKSCVLLSGCWRS
jgi:hypothetical protein